MEDQEDITATFPVSKITMLWCQFLLLTCLFVLHKWTFAYGFSFYRLDFILEKLLTWKKLQIFVSWSMTETYLAQLRNCFHFRALVLRWLIWYVWVCNSFPCSKKHIGLVFWSPIVLLVWCPRLWTLDGTMFKGYV